MKNALIVHGTNGHSKENWFPWLAGEIQQKGFHVYVPDLPQPETPSIPVWNSFIRRKWSFDNDSIIIGHSSGAVATLGLLQELPINVKVNKVLLVAGFTTDLDWDVLHELFTYSFDWQTIKSRAKKFVLFHSDDDPYVPLWHGEKLKKLLGAKLILMKGQKHFSVSTDPKYTIFPKLLEKILE